MMTSTAAEARAARIGLLVNKLERGELSVAEAAGLAGVTDRTLRRWKKRYRCFGTEGLIDRRSHAAMVRKRVPGQHLAILRAYRHWPRKGALAEFQRHLKSSLGIDVPYSFLRSVLCRAGMLIARGRGGETPTADCFGQRLVVGFQHLEAASMNNASLALLVTIIDEATCFVLRAHVYASFAESDAVALLHSTVVGFGVPLSLGVPTSATTAGQVATDAFASLAFRQGVERLGVELEPGRTAEWSPPHLDDFFAALLQHELKARGHHSLAAINAYLHDHYLPAYNGQLSRHPHDFESNFVPASEAVVAKCLSAKNETDPK